MTASVYTRKYEFFRELLCEARKSYPLTQSEMAKILGKPQSFVSKYETGERRIDIIEFLQIADALNIDPVLIIRKLHESKDDNI